MTETTIIVKENGMMSLAQPLDQCPATVYISGLSAASSRRTMKHALGIMADILSNGQADCLTLPWHELSFQHVQAVRTDLSAKYSMHTVNKFLSALRGTLKAAWRLGQMSAEHYHLAASVENVKGETLPAGRHIPSGELAALLDNCARDDSAGGIRDGAMIALLYCCGLRRDEIIGLDLADFNAELEQLVIRGKGNKERIVHTVNGANAALADWLTIRGDEPGPLFHRVRKGGAILEGRLTGQAVYHILDTRAKKAGVATLTPHDFRRTFISDLLDAGADISTVAKMAGHRNVGTTQRYDRRPEATKRAAANLLHVPYRRRRKLR